MNWQRRRSTIMQCKLVQRVVGLFVDSQQTTKSNRILLHLEKERSFSNDLFHTILRCISRPFCVALLHLIDCALFLSKLKMPTWPSISIDHLHSVHARSMKAQTHASIVKNAHSRPNFSLMLRLGGPCLFRATTHCYTKAGVPRGRNTTRLQAILVSSIAPVFIYHRFCLAWLLRRRAESICS